MGLMLAFLWRYRAAFAALALAGAVFAGFVWVRSLQADNARLRTAVKAAEAQGQLNQTAAAITERVVRSEVTINTRAERAADEVRSLPGADAQLDPGFGAGLADSLRRMRQPPESAANPGQ